uniref:Integrase core domain containing protein n=1 Tax=Solanum tuberosum TaxID=4113 RepID=M1B5N4_SOLTU
MSSNVEVVVEKDDDEIEVTGESKNAIEKNEEGKYRSNLKSVSVVNHIEKRGSDVSIEERLGVDALAAVMMNFDGDGIEHYDELVAVLDRKQDLAQDCPFLLIPGFL